eukprot:15436006-Alexandrium_andersonii.AAC.1
MTDATIARAVAVRRLQPSSRPGWGNGAPSCVVQSLPQAGCGRQVRRAAATARQWRAGLCKRHWAAQVASGKERSLRHLQARLSPWPPSQAAAAARQWLLRAPVSAGHWTEPGRVLVVKQTHFFNSGLHVAQGRGGVQAGGPLTVANCPLDLRRRLADLSAGARPAWTWRHRQ